MSSKILFTFTEHDTLIGVGTFNDKYLIVTSDCDGEVKARDKIKQMKILDTFHYKQILNTMFNVNDKANVLFITRSELESSTEVEVVLTITRKEYELINELYNE